ncbi:MAG: hypothetical protein M1820_006378 [Bogoriella megaspora]|nr:MAG: hypothetical protein M1820_006378 [Bogoriella megaspora]
MDMSAQIRALPFAEKWDALKSELERLYFDEKNTLPEIEKKMKQEYNFDANGNQYKYHFKKWSWSKNVPAAKKEKILKIGQTRAASGKSTAAVYKGKQVDKGKLRRQAKKRYRETESFVPKIRDLDHTSPFGQAVSTPSDVLVQTPRQDGPSSPSNALSPLAIELKTRTAGDMAALFVKGDHDSLLQQLHTTDRKLFVTWLNQFWFFAYKTAKHWGKGPLVWTADMLRFSEIESFGLSPPPEAPSPVPIARTRGLDESDSERCYRPSDLCRWSVHVSEDNTYDDDDDDAPPSPPQIGAFSNLDDESTWGNWPEVEYQPSYDERLTQNLVTNDFTDVKVDNLSIATNHIASAARISPKQMIKESLGFSIMSGNIFLMYERIIKVFKDEIDVSDIYPYHLAASYLHGAKTCCNIIDCLLYRCGSLTIPIRKAYTNELGHTVLDTLMMSILRAHSSAVPGDVDDSLKEQHRFVGEEVDVCGRWDADSQIYRQLMASGATHVPLSWKHKFCHTSVLTICHSIQALSMRASLLNTPSGLFLKHCTFCGRKLQLSPMHTLIFAAWMLTIKGCREEDLFGVIAILLCLISEGVDPRCMASVSLSALSISPEMHGCDHEEQRPSQFASKIFKCLPQDCTATLRTGWDVLYRLLRRLDEPPPTVPEGQQSGSSDMFTMEEEDMLECDEFLEPDFQESLLNYRTGCCTRCLYSASPRPFGKDKYLGHIWASIQTELLNYRRLNVSDPWLSANFDMVSLLKSLETDTPVSFGLVERDMMHPYCACGRFDVLACPIREHTSAYYFANLDDWHHVGNHTKEGKKVCVQLEKYDEAGRTYRHCQRRKAGERVLILFGSTSGRVTITGILKIQSELRFLTTSEPKRRPPRRSHTQLCLIYTSISELMKEYQGASIVNECQEMNTNTTEMRGSYVPAFMTLNPMGYRFNGEEEVSSRNSDNGFVRFCRAAILRPEFGPRLAGKRLALLCTPSTPFPSPTLPLMEFAMSAVIKRLTMWAVVSIFCTSESH